MSTIDGENAKVLRKSMEVRVSFITSSTYTWVGPDEIISCFLDLRSVNTDIENPTLQASTIEVSFKFESDWDNETFMRNYKGKAARIQYRAGYWDTFEDLSDMRTFYTSMDAESLEYENGVVTVRGTDLAGYINDVAPGGLISDFETAGYTIICGDVQTLVNKYIYQMLKPFLPNLTPPVVGRLSGTVYDGPCEMVDPWDGYQWSNYIVVEPQTSRRKLIGQWMNIFRGKATDLEHTLGEMKFIFRDAGIPEAGWFYGLDGSNPSSTINLRKFNLSYNDVADLKETKGTEYSRVIIDCSNEYKAQAEVIEQRDVQTGIVYKVETQKPYDDLNAGADWVSVLSPWCIKYSAYNPGQGVRTVSVGGNPILTNDYELDNIAETEDGSLIIEINSDGKNDLVLDKFLGLRDFDYRKGWDESLPYTRGGIPYFIQEQWGDNDYITRPTFITFKWRGDPRMQPRDLIRFTNKDNTVSLYEVDSLTLEHKDGGLISEVRAMLRMENYWS